MSYIEVLDLSVVVPRSTNNFGSFQFPEQDFSLHTINLLPDSQFSLCDCGRNEHDWLPSRASSGRLGAQC